MGSKEPERPEIYGVKRGGGAWRLGRRRFLAGAAAGAALSGVGAGFKNGTKSSPMTKKATAAEPECKKVLAHVDGIPSTTMAFFSDNSLFASAGRDSMVKLWQVSTGGLESRLEGQTGTIGSLAITPDGKWIASGNSRGELCIWNVRRRKSRKTIKLVTDEDISHIKVAIGADGKYCAVEAQDVIHILTIPKGTKINSWQAGRYVEIIALTPDSKRVVAAVSKSIEIWKLDGSFNASLEAGFQAHDNTIYDMAVSPDGSCFVTVSMTEPAVRIWSLPGGSFVKSFSPNSDYILAAAISPDGKYIATGARNDYIVLSAFPSGKLKKRLGSSSEHVTALAFSPDGKTLAAGYADGAIKMWDVKTGGQLRCLMDVESNDDTKSGTTYRYKAGKNKWVTVTLPVCACAPPIPEGAECTCNTVEGTNPCPCVGYVCSCQGHGSCPGVYYFPN
jgi:WD40 repeat protein